MPLGNDWVKPLDPPHRGIEVFLAQVCVSFRRGDRVVADQLPDGAQRNPMYRQHKPKVCRNIEGRIGLQVTSPHQRIE